LVGFHARSFAVIMLVSDLWVKEGGAKIYIIRKDSARP
jgi:hypothetical protein